MCTTKMPPCTVYRSITKRETPSTYWQNPTLNVQPQCNIGKLSGSDGCSNFVNIQGHVFALTQQISERLTRTK